MTTRSRERISQTHFAAMNKDRGIFGDIMLNPIKYLNLSEPSS